MTDVDNFFVGDGSAKLMNDCYIEEEAHARQIAHFSKDSVVAKDDLSNYVPDEVSPVSFEDVEWAFHEFKKEAYAYFGYEKIKSRNFGDVPIKVEDLVLDEADKYLMHYLRNRVTDLYVWKNLAYLQAFVEMRVPFVRFEPEHSCVLCDTHRGSILGTQSVLRSLCSGGSISHAHCDSVLFPVIHREKYVGPLEGHLDVEVVLQGEIDLLNVPREYHSQKLFDLFTEDFPCLDVDFVNMATWCKGNDYPVGKGVVAAIQGETLYVHNSYVMAQGPLDFIAGFLEGHLLPDKVDVSVLEGADQYIIGGNLAVRYNGQYYSPKTGQRLK